VSGIRGIMMSQLKIIPFEPKKHLEFVVNSYYQEFGKVLGYDKKHPAPKYVKDSARESIVNLEQTILIAVCSGKPAGFIQFQKRMYSDALAFYACCVHLNSSLNRLKINREAAELQYSWLKGEVFSSKPAGITLANHSITQVASTDAAKSVIFVLPGYQRRGLGSRLSSEAELLAKEAGAEQMFTTCLAGMPTHKMNLKLGYEEIAFFEQMYRNRHDGVVMAKKLC